MAVIVRLDDYRLRSVFSYPRFSGIHYSKVLSDLEAMGVDGICSEGRLEIGEILVLGKGCVGIVLLGSARGKEVALKVLRSDANRRSLKVEGGYLAIANGCRGTERSGARTVGTISSASRTRGPKSFVPMR